MEIVMGVMLLFWLCIASWLYRLAERLRLQLAEKEETLALARTRIYDAYSSEGQLANELRRLLRVAAMAQCDRQVALAVLNVCLARAR